MYLPADGGASMGGLSKQGGIMRQYGLGIAGEKANFSSRIHGHHEHKVNSCFFTFFG